MGQKPHRLGPGLGDQEAVERVAVVGRQGLDRNGMPFGLQVVGPRGGDRLVLGVAAAIEEAFAGDAARCRPVPDLAKLKAAKPVKDMPGAVGWD